jgi:hypothetical protein
LSEQHKIVAAVYQATVSPATKTGTVVHDRFDTIFQLPVGVEVGPYHPENYVIGAISDSLTVMAGWVLRRLSAVRTRLHQRVDLPAGIYSPAPSAHGAAANRHTASMLPPE